MSLKRCPFCGGHAYFTQPEWKDDRRYVQMTLECCIVSVSDSLAWGQARGMSPENIAEHLKISLTTLWNDRYNEDTDEEPQVKMPEPDIPTATLEEVVKQFDPKFGRF